MGGSSGKEHTCQCRRHKRSRFDSWVGKIPWRTWQPTSVLLPGESNEQRSLADYSPVQFNSVAQLCLTLCNPMDCSRQGVPVSHPELSQTQVHRVGDAIQQSHSLSSPSPPAPIPPSIRVFFNESTLRMRWPKYWSFSFSIIPSKEHPGLISFRMDWLDLLVVQGTRKSLLQHHSSKASILRCSAFFTVQL